ncbi:MAG: hypothetical protein HQL51_16775, partial [Magnetococcales bacterium]|nr:hypothetical protein [Magnetococcales bacterium]
GDQPYDDKGQFAGGEGCGGGGRLFPVRDWTKAQAAQVQAMMNGDPMPSIVDLYHEYNTDNMTLLASNSLSGVSGTEDHLVMIGQVEGRTYRTIEEFLLALLEALQKGIELEPDGSLPTPPIPMEKPEISKEEWAEFSQALDKVPGMDAKLKFAIMMTVAWEGGSKKNGTVLTGLTPIVMKDNRTLELLPVGLRSKMPKNMSVEERVTVIKAHLDAMFWKAGGLDAVRSAIPDPKMLATVLDTAYQHGGLEGGGVLRWAANQFYNKEGGDWPDGYLDRQTLTRLETLGNNRLLREGLLNKIHEGRTDLHNVKFLEQGRGGEMVDKKPGNHPRFKFFRW